MLPFLLSTAQRSWMKPVPSHPILKCIDKLYRVHDPRVFFLQKQPAMDSIFAETSQSPSRHRQSLISPNKDSRRIDSMGSWLYSSAAFTMRVANYQATMGTYQHFLWDSMSSGTICPLLRHYQRTKKCWCKHSSKKVFLLLNSKCYQLDTLWT